VAKYKVIFFDLDGTLVDTAPDLAYALNQLLQQEGKDSLPYEAIRPVASHGSVALLDLGFGIDATHPNFSSLQQRFIQLYQENISRLSTLFDGMDVVIENLDKEGYKWGVITNKPAFLTDPLLAALKLDTRAVCVVSGDTTANSKPHPEPMLHACKLADVEPHNCIYIGDAERDIEAGRNVNMRTLLAGYGYIGDSDDPESWQADAIINDPREILQWI
jgi:phosphoglycolate phosphatase